MALYNRIRDRLTLLQDGPLNQRIEAQAKRVESLFRESEKIIWLEKYGKLVQTYPGIVEIWKLAPQVPELKPLLPLLPAY